MIEAWGYDTRHPSEVMAEYPLKLPGGGNGRADYVIMHNDKPAIVIECKTAERLNDPDIIGQLQSYVNAIGATVGVFTNGTQYSCYADTDEAGRMDFAPFSTTNVTDPTSESNTALSPLVKEFFSPARLRTTAKSMKVKLDRTYDIDVALETSLIGDDMYRLGAIKSETRRVAEVEALADEVRGRLQSLVDVIARNGLSREGGVVTTNDEMDAYLIVKGMLHGTISPSRIGHRDVRTYFSVLVDNNNRKPICRFYFNGRVKQVGTFDQDKQETKHPIEDFDDIFDLAARLRRTARQYNES